MSESTSQPTTYCYCGCGLAANPKANYRHGHDAKHAGAVARRLFDSVDPSSWNTEADKALPTISLATKAVMAARNLERISAVKAERDAKKAQRERARAERLEAAQRKQTDRLVADQAAKNDEAQPVYEGGFTGIILGGIDGDEVVAEFHVPEGIVETGEVKVGRWTYPTRTWDGGVIERNEKRDGSGAWIVIN